MFEEEIFQHRGAAMTLEGRGVLASQDPASGLLTVWSGTQTPHICRATIADLLDRDLEDVRVIAPFVGGGFGTKAPFYAEEIVIPVAALKLGAAHVWAVDLDPQALLATRSNAGINGVPCFILGGVFAVSGAQSPEYLADAIERAAAERRAAAPAEPQA